MSTPEVLELGPDTDGAPVKPGDLAWLKTKGVEPIVATDFSSRRRAIAAAMGAHDVVDPAAEPGIDAWRRLDGSKQSRS